MKKVVHDSGARIKALTRFIQDHATHVLELCGSTPHDAHLEFIVSDVKRDGSVRIKFYCRDHLYTRVTLCTGLHFRDVKTCTYDDVYAHVPLADVPLDLKWVQRADDES